MPLTDAQLYVRALRARGEDAPEMKTIVFPEDTHALDRPQTVSGAGWPMHEHASACLALHAAWHM